MSLRHAFFALGVVLAAAVMPVAHAQEDSPVRWHIMGGINEPLGTSATYFNTGWNFGFGVTFRQPGSPLGVRLDFDYGTNNASHQLLNLASGAAQTNITGGWANIWNMNVNLEARHLFGNVMYGYLIGGVGVAYTNIQLTQYGYGYICDPWWGYCYVGSGQSIVASNSATNFTTNAGAGLAFRMQSGIELFVEGRYNWIYMSHGTFGYIPILFGVRF